MKLLSNSEKSTKLSNIDGGEQDAVIHFKH